MNEIEAMKPLYPPEGAPVCGYLCCERQNGRACRRVTRTQRGMWTHLRKVHGVKRQPELPFVNQAEKMTEQRDTL